MLGCNLVCIYIKQIRQIPEGVKGKTNGQGQLRVGDVNACNTSKSIQKETIVFKKYKNAKVDDNGENQVLLLFFSIKNKPFQFGSHIIIKYAGEKHKDHINRFAPCVKYQAA